MMQIHRCASVVCACVHLPVHLSLFVAWLNPDAHLRPDRVCEKMCATGRGVRVCVRAEVVYRLTQLGGRRAELVLHVEYVPIQSPLSGPCKLGQERRSSSTVAPSLPSNAAKPSIRLTTDD